MALIVETGTGTNAGATSYATVQELRDYASARGIDLSSVTDAAAEVFLIKSMDYLESLAPKYKGMKSTLAQPLQWPRVDVWGVGFFDALLPSGEIPRELVYAQLSLAVEAFAGNELMPNDDGKGAIVKERIEGAIEVAYQNIGGAKRPPAFSKASALLSSLLKYNGMVLTRS